MNLKQHFWPGASALALAVLLSACQSSAISAADGHDAKAWRQLQTQVGSYQDASPFLQQGVMATHLNHLLGAQTTVFLRNLEVAGPLKKEGSVYFITGNRQHEGGHNAAAIALDARTNTMRVWWLQNGQPRVIQDAGAAFRWPHEVNAMINSVVAAPAH